eukprot:6313553-Lingulodinium_polyedra.AAC.1
MLEDELRRAAAGDCVHTLPGPGAVAGGLRRHERRTASRGSRWLVCHVGETTTRTHRRAPPPP